MSNFEQNICNIYGAMGRAWLLDLPEIVKVMSDKYGLSGLEPVSNLSCNYVMRGLQGDASVVLKLGLDVDGLKREVLALKAFAGFGAVKVLAQEDGIIVMEDATPGTSLKKVQDAEAINIVCQLMQRLHQASIDYRFPHISDWLAVLDKDWSIPHDHLKKARDLRNKLLKTLDNPVLLHGDLHQGNILKKGDGWVVIDPKGVVGEFAYEVAAFIRNPMPELLDCVDVGGIIKARIDGFAVILQIDHERIINWCFVQAVLAWAWALEDGGDPSCFARLVDVL